MKLISAFTLALASFILAWFYFGSAPKALPRAPDYQRIVTMAPSYCETVVALGQAHRLVGITNHCDLDEVANLPRIGSFAEANFEVILSLKPDLVLAVPHAFAFENLRRLKESGIEVFAHQPDSLHDIRFINQHLATMLGVENRGHLLNKRIDAALTKAKSLAGQRKPENPTILMAIAHSPLVVAGADTFITEIVEAMGFSNLATNLSAAWPIWPLEALITTPPDILLLLEGQESLGLYQRLLKSVNLELFNFGPTLIVPKRPLFFSPSPAIIEDIEYFSNLLSTSA